MIKLTKEAQIRPGESHVVFKHGNVILNAQPLLNFANHDFIAVLWTDPVGIRITNIVLGMMAVGAIWLYRLSHIRV